MIHKKDLKLILPDTKLNVMHSFEALFETLAENVLDGYHDGKQWIAIPLTDGVYVPVCHSHPQPYVITLPKKKKVTVTAIEGAAILTLIALDMILYQLEQLGVTDHRAEQVMHLYYRIHAKLIKVSDQYSEIHRILE